MRYALCAWRGAFRSSHVGRAPALLFGLYSRRDLAGDNPQLGLRAAHPLALGPLKAAAPARLMVLHPLAAVPHDLAPVNRVLQDANRRRRARA